MLLPGFLPKLTAATSHPVSNTSPCITTPVFTSAHHQISKSAHQHISTSSNQHIIKSAHQHIIKSAHHQISTSAHFKLAHQISRFSIPKSAVGFFDCGAAFLPLYFAGRKSKTIQPEGRVFGREQG